MGHLRAPHFPLLRLGYQCHRIHNAYPGRISDGHQLDRNEHGRGMFSHPPWSLGLRSGGWYASHFDRGLFPYPGPLLYPHRIRSHRICRLPPHRVACKDVGVAPAGRC
jgi:hypothetical protein